MNNAYEEFLENKIKVAERAGVQIDRTLLHPSGKPHQNDIIEWALARGNGLIAADCGMGKSHMAIECFRLLHQLIGGKYLIVTELGASETFTHPDPEIGEAARLGIQLEYVQNREEAIASECFIVVTNYERVRMGCFDFSAFMGVWLDEGNYIKNMASETTDSLSRGLAKVKWKYIATATPSPNDTLEIINYAHVLGICDRGQILTRFFQRNSTKAGELTLHPQHEDDFWLWVSSWAVFITQPSDLGYPNEGYELPELKVFWHEVKINQAIEGRPERDGQGRMFTDANGSLPDAARIKRQSINSRIDKALAIMSVNGAEDVDHWIIWHHLEDERKCLNQIFKGFAWYGDVYGTQAWEARERKIVAFAKGELQVLATKPSLTGVGCNFQKHCHKAIALGITYSWDEFYQAIIKRIHRFGQRFPCEIHAIYTPEEYEIVNNLKEKWRLHDEQREKMRQIVVKCGLNQSEAIAERRRSFHVERQEWKGKNWTLVNADCVTEFRRLPENSVDMILTSIPFGNHYEYTDKYNDFGHNQSNEEFFRQMDFLVPELLRVLKPGRIAAIHTKNRIHYGSVTGLGMSVMHRFTHAASDCFERNGFHCLGFHYVPTDVVAENNQTYRLTFGEMKKDSTKMGAGIPEEIWTFRKAPTSNSNAYADEPVGKKESEVSYICSTCQYSTNEHDEFIRETEGELVKRVGWHAADSGEESLYRCPDCNKFTRITQNTVAGYTLAQWQLDADCFWRSSGNRYLSPYELKAWGIDKLQAWWKRFNSETVYDYEEHVKLLQSLDDNRKLSRTFTTLPLRSNSPFVWNDVNRMHGLNMEQSRRKQRNHICPMPFDQVDRLIELYSNPGELIADPFAGLGTTGVRALKKGRRALLTELNEVYATCARTYLTETEYKNSIPTLFDSLTEQKQAV